MITLIYKLNIHKKYNYHINTSLLYAQIYIQIYFAFLQLTKKPATISILLFSENRPYQTIKHTTHFKGIQFSYGLAHKGTTPLSVNNVI